MSIHVTPSQVRLNESSYVTPSHVRVNESSYPARLRSSPPIIRTISDHVPERVASVREFSPRRSYYAPDRYVVTERASATRLVLPREKEENIKYDYTPIMEELGREEPIGLYYRDTHELLLHAMDVLRRERTEHNDQIRQMELQLNSYKAVCIEEDLGYKQKEQLIKMVEVRGKDIKSLKSDNEVLMGENEELRRAYAKLKEKYRVLAGEIKSLQDERAELELWLTSENAKLRKDYEAQLARQQLNFQQQLRLLEEENSRLRQELERLKAEHSKCGPEIKSLRIRITELEAEIQRLRIPAPVPTRHIPPADDLALEEVEEW
uniref:Uncharacterized protein n=1 Tax=Eutreptiella gymnastica TaxID=73025 RepID=A0A7S1IHY5_9EUGL|mmetsp:Transcript_17980/g.31952  ORF Transcript_17980/g.31952 Transcript_17980/m.31952 type:complete len:321 (+) Transcript_17980:42-1004(+)